MTEITMLISAVSAYTVLALAAQVIRARFGPFVLLITSIALANVALAFIPARVGAYSDLLPHAISVWLAVGITCAIAVATDYRLRHFVKFSKIAAPAPDRAILDRVVPGASQLSDAAFSTIPLFDYYAAEGSKISKALAIFDNPESLAISGYVSPHDSRNYVGKLMVDATPIKQATDTGDRTSISAENTTFLFSCLYAHLKMERPSLLLVADSLLFALLFWPLEAWRLLVQPSIKDL